MGTLGQIKLYEKHKPKEDVCCWVWDDEEKWYDICNGLEHLPRHKDEPTYFNFCPYCGKPIKVVDNE